LFFPEVYYVIVNLKLISGVQTLFNTSFISFCESILLEYEIITKLLWVEDEDGFPQFCIFVLESKGASGLLVDKFSSKLFV